LRQQLSMRPSHKGREIMQLLFTFGRTVRNV
jgi:hypothetical protein